MTAWSARLLRPLEWEPLPDGTIRLRDPSRGEWVRTQAWTRAVLESLDAGARGPDAVEAALAHPEAPSGLRARRFLLSLEKVGYLKVEVPVPESFGPWRVLGELGRGGVGIAYACERDGLAAVAKTPWDFLYAWDKAETALRHEAGVLARLDHPAIVRRLDWLDGNGAPVLVRERVDGHSLTELHDGKPAGAREAAAITREIGAILAHLHERGLVLVDYKPSNFLHDERAGRLRLLDAGHARAMGSSRVGGTPGFMPPELERRESASIASDVWGLGRLYAFLRTGRLPALRSKEETPLDALPEAAVPFVSALCAPDPATRPQTVEKALALLP